MNLNKKSVVFSMNAKLSFKLIVVGNKHAGKTSLILRFVKNIFEFNYKVTIGVQFYSKIINIGDEQIALQIWDTAGSQHYKSVVRSFYNFTHCVLIVYDKADDLNINIVNWMSDIKQHARQFVKLILVRTKIDINPIQPDQQIKIKQIISKYSIHIYMPVSSKSNENITKLFSQIGASLLNSYQNDENFRQIVDKKNQSILLNSIEQQNPTKTKRNSCCKN